MISSASLFEEIVACCPEAGAIEVAVPDVAVRAISHDQHCARRMQLEGAKLVSSNIEPGDFVTARHLRTRACHRLP